MNQIKKYNKHSMAKKIAQLMVDKKAVDINIINISSVSRLVL